MGKIYFKKTSKEETFNQLRPKEETIQFLLNYSKALNVKKLKNMEFEMLLN